MADALAGFPLALVSDMSVYDYEKNHLPAGTWPPTSWYAEWVSGQDVFDVPPRRTPDRDALAGVREIKLGARVTHEKN